MVPREFLLSLLGHDGLRCAHKPSTSEWSSREWHEFWKIRTDNLNWSPSLQQKGPCTMNVREQRPLITSAYHRTNDNVCLCLGNSGGLSPARSLASSSSLAHPQVKDSRIWLAMFRITRCLTFQWSLRSSNNLNRDRRYLFFWIGNRYRYERPRKTFVHHSLLRKLNSIEHTQFADRLLRQVWYIAWISRDILVIDQIMKCLSPCLVNNEQSCGNLT